jgi:hypothetical protein
VRFEGQVSGRRKARLLTGHRYGISARPDEAFGISVAEMVKAGCIVFVPDGGGHTEIVDHPALVFPDRDGAVRRVCAVLRSTSTQAQLRVHLSGQGRLFSVDRFRREARRVVFDALAQQGADPRA